MLQQKSPTKWQQHINVLFLSGQYAEAAVLYEKAIDVEPDVRSHYWYLGLAYLLQGKETEAQTTWMLVLADAPDGDESAWTQELLLVLDEEAARFQIDNAPETAWLIRQTIQEIDASNLNNLLLLIQLSIELKQLSIENFEEWKVLELLQDESTSAVHTGLLANTISQLLQTAPFESVVFDVTAASVPYFKIEPELLIDVLISQSSRIGHGEHAPALGVRILELALKLTSDNFNVLSNLSVLYQNAHRHEEGIAAARRSYELAGTSTEKIIASGILLRGMMAVGGYWTQVEQVFREQLNLFKQFIEEYPTDLTRRDTLFMFNSPFFQPYLRDDLTANRFIQNNVTKICQENVQNYASELVQRFKSRHYQPLVNRPLRIGYVSSCLRQHSVGWLARWLYEYHDHDLFDIYSYCVSYRFHGDDWLRDWYESKSDKHYKLDADGPAIAERIFEDEIDVLIDLDSATLDTTCEIMALKPAPVQVSWLGWDATGIPGIDYYIVDPYVLPEGAEQFYSETLWRMPQTYIAVEGFEQGIPSLRRENLDVPSDAIIYFSGQRGHKRYPETVRLQMKILSNVPNGYFLIKNPDDDDTLKAFFIRLAEEEGVSGDRLRFLPNVSSEPIHRANLMIADVVLDTYPYTGATTTLETLWFGIPLVTRVGEHFSSRNSYTMMVNAGISEGIAWTDDEYVDWGIRLGHDESLRAMISWKLRKSRKAAPLWNSQKFTRDIEAAYQEMCLRA